MGGGQSKDAEPAVKETIEAGPVPVTLSATEKLIDRILSVIEKDVLPEAQNALKAAGVHVDGCAILRKSDLTLVVTGANAESINPIFSPEVNAIIKFYELPTQWRPDPKDCYFVSTHEPCCVSLCALGQCGFDNFYYLFDMYGKTRAGGVGRPKDQKMMMALYGTPDGRYSKVNAFWRGVDVKKMIEDECSEGRKTRFMVRVGQLKTAYDGLVAKP